MKLALIFFCCVALLVITPRVAFARMGAVPKDSPPPGIVPTSATLSQVLKSHDAAVGRLIKSSATGRTEVWRFTQAGAQGTERLIRRGTDYHSIIQTGPLTEEYGQSGDARWHMNENGVVSDISRTDISSFEMFRVLEDASDPKNDVKLLGEAQDPQPAYVIEVNRPAIQVPEWIYFDKKTFFIIRTEQVVDKRRLVSTYDDYQTVQGLTEPSHVHDSEGTASLDADYRRQSLTFSNSVGVGEFQKPASHASFMRVDHPVGLDARIVEGTVVVRLNVNNRGLDFELSSGDSHSYIDDGVAEELHLPTFGHATYAEGSPVPYETELAEATVGDLHLEHFALEALPFHYHADIGTRVVGVLGHDFLSSGLFVVDYVNKRVTVSPTTEMPAETGDMYVIPVQFDDGLPFFTSTIMSHETKNVLLDSSFTFSYVLGSFSQQYPEAVVDSEGGRQHRHAVIPFADSRSYGRDLDVWIAKVPDIRIGPVHFVHYEIVATNAEMELGGHQIDAVIGTQFLIFYDVYYDFAHDRVLLRPNDFFKKTFRLEKP